MTSDLRYGPKGYLSELKRYILCMFWFLHARMHKPLLVVLSPPKTGTTSLESALKNAGRPPIKCHGLGPQVAKAHAARRAASFIRTQNSFNEDRMVQLYSSGHRFRLLTGVRDPVARRISQVLQTPDVYGLKPSDGVEVFHKQILNWLRQDLEQGGSLSWYRLDFADPLGLNLDRLHFDLQTGHGLLEEDRAKVLFFRTDRLDELWPVLSAFSGARLSASHENVRRNTSLAGLYTSIRDGFIVSANLIDSILADPLIPVFFGIEEQEAMRERWSVRRRQ